VQWGIITSGVTGDPTRSIAAQHFWVERIDRFWFNANPDAEVGIECMGVFDLAPDGRIAAIRDYVDMTAWRSRKAAVE
jgi:limonene-1,2-epoxide hydrolase